MLGEGKAVPIRQPDTEGIAFVHPAFEVQVIGRRYAHETHEVLNLRTPGEPVPQFGIERGVARLKVIESKRISGSLNIKRKPARHSKLNP